MYAVHSCAKYGSDPRKEHGATALAIAMYLKFTRTLGPNTDKSRAGWFIFYAGCPIIWACRLETQVALSTTEVEYHAFSVSLRDIIPAMELVAEVRSKGFPVLYTEPSVYCKVFEGNSGALELARLPKFRPRTKHTNVCWHHFRDYMHRGLINIFPCDTKWMAADALPKPCTDKTFA
ncbi:hypothetical protein ACHAWF_009796, partial [Thalassiosira exigua]